MNLKPTSLPASVTEAMKKYPPFYQKVWLACARIPAGKTRTYGELAAEIGSPKAARAVARALSKNPFAPLVPCHRVVAKNGLGGYSGPGGTAAKLAMLIKENAVDETERFK